MKKIGLIVIFLAAIVSVWAVPAHKRGILVAQPDGSQITVYQHGDEFFHWETNEKGEWIAKDENGFYELVPALTETEIVSRRATAPRKRITEQQQASELNIAPRGLIILVNFADVAFKTDKAELDSMLTGENYTRNYSYVYNKYTYNISSNGSARQYFQDASFGQYNPQFDVVGPVTLSETMAYYGKNNPSTGQDMRPEEMILDACKLVDDSVDFTLYDNNNDGVVDFVYVFYAGFGEADGGGANTIWPHQYFASWWETVRLDGKKIDRYACSNELRFYNRWCKSSHLCRLGYPRLWSIYQ